MRILMLSSWVSHDPRDPTLVNDLAVELAQQGHDVLLYAQDWDNRTGKTAKFTASGVHFLWQKHAASGLRLGPLALPLKWLLTSIIGWRNFRSQIKAFDPEAVIGFSPALIHFNVVRHILPAKRRPSLIIQWDFFPIHHWEIGMFRGRALKWAAQNFEESMLRRFRYVGHMSARNLEFFRRWYPHCHRMKQLLVPIWGAKPSAESPVDTTDLRLEFGLPEDKVIVVFGGQLSKGRGFENILKLASRCEAEIPNCHFAILGQGKLRTWLQAEIEKLPNRNITLMDRIPRNLYQRFLQGMDIGLVSTDGGTSVPTFPSKSIDYMRNALPMLVVTEEGTDFRKTVEDAGAGLVSVAGDDETLISNLRILASDSALRERMGNAALELFTRSYNVERIARAIVENLSGQQIEK